MSAATTVDLGDDRILDRDEAAAMLGVTPRWLEDAMRDRIVPHRRVGRQRAMTVGDVRTFIRSAAQHPLI